MDVCLNPSIIDLKVVRSSKPQSGTVRASARSYNQIFFKAADSDYSERATVHRTVARSARRVLGSLFLFMYHVHEHRGR